METRDHAWRNFLDCVPGGAAVLDERAEKLLDANDELLTALGLSRDSLGERSFASLLHVEDPGGDLRKGGARCLRHANGSGRWFEVVGKPREGFFVATFSPANAERRELEARLLLAERLVSLGTLAAGVAHEINNPLTYISLNLGFLGRELTGLARELQTPSASMPPPPLDERRLELRARVERATEALRVTKEGAERVATIVRDLRMFSRSADDDRGPLDLTRVLDSAISIAWNEIRHRARLAKEFGDVPPVEANEGRLAQVFVHLLLNAAHALPEGDASRHEVRVALSTDTQGRAVVEVRDTGAGIAPEHLDRIFDPFFTTKPVGSGTGLGLSVCHGIISSLGGTITVESRVGGGSTFRVVLPPFVRPQPEEEDRRSLVPSPRSPRPRVLIIDDEPFVVSALRRTLEPDADVLTTDSGRDGIELLLRDQRFDVILCDLMMPDIAGMDVYEAVRRARPGVEQAFVFMTGGAFTQRGRDFVAAVPNRFVDKPLDPAELKRLVRESRGKK